MGSLYIEAQGYVSVLLENFRGISGMHSPGLSHSGSVSGSWVLHKAQTWLGQHFVPVTGPRISGDQVLGKHSSPELKAVSYSLPCLSCLVFCVYNRRAFSGVPCVSSGELIPGCNPPGGCQPSRIPRSLG